MVTVNQPYIDLHKEDKKSKRDSCQVLGKMTKMKSNQSILSHGANILPCRQRDSVMAILDIYKMAHLESFEG